MRGRQRAFTYLGVLILVAILGSLLAVAGRAWRTQVMRERETELLFVGDQYRQAIRRYADNTPAGAPRYPGELKDLLKDPRRPVIARYLRKLYRDPITGSRDWGIVKAPDGGIAGVYSRSEDKPFKQSNFSAKDASFEAKEKYSEWWFVSLSEGANASSRSRPAN